MKEKRLPCTYVTNRTHLSDYKVYSQTEYQSRYEIKMSVIGSYAHEYFNMLIKNKQSYWMISVRAILGMEKEYGKEAVNLSLKRALYYEVADCQTIKNILKNKLYLLELEPKQEEIKGEEYSMSRSLKYYEEGGYS